MDLNNHRIGSTFPKITSKRFKKIFQNLKFCILHWSQHFMALGKLWTLFTKQSPNTFDIYVCDQAKWVWSRSNSLSFCWLIVYIYISLAKLPFTTDPINIGKLVPKIQVDEGLQSSRKQRNYHLKIHICNSSSNSFCSITSHIFPTMGDFIFSTVFMNKNSGRITASSWYLLGWAGNFSNVQAWLAGKNLECSTVIQLLGF